MKPFLSIAFLFCLFLAPVISSRGAEPFVVPSFVKELKDLDDVKKDAAVNNLGVTFLLMEPGST